MAQSCRDTGQQRYGSLKLVPFVPTIPPVSLAAKIFPLELLEVFFSEHSALSLLLLLLVLRLGH